MSIVHLVDGLRGLHLHLARRRVDALGDLRLNRDQQLTSATFQEVIIWFHFKFLDLSSVPNL